MIVFDIETSGIDPQIHGMLSLGAVDYDTGQLFMENVDWNPTKNGMNLP